jgi:hypothetical protein
LGIAVCGDEVNTGNTDLYHPVYGIAASTAYANYFDLCSSQRSGFHCYLLL